MKTGDSIPVSVLAHKNTTWKQKLSNFVRLNFFIPDAKTGWIPYAVSEGKKIIEKEKPDIIFSTSPPPTVHLIAAKLVKWSGIKWVADFRDPWTKIHYLQQQRINPISKRINKNLEKKVIENCDAATCVSNNFVNLLTKTYSLKFTVITNGFDSEINCPVLKNADKFTVLYIGGLAWTRYYPEFILSVAKLFENGKLNSDFTEIQFVGSIEKDILEDIQKKFKHAPNIQFINYVIHEKALEFMHKADLLLLFLEKGKDYEGHIPGKLFEYLSTGNRILGIGNKNGDTAKIMEKTGAGKIFEPDETDKIEEEITSQFNRWKNKIPREQQINTDEVNKYTRKRLTQKLAELFDNRSSV